MDVTEIELRRVLGANLRRRREELGLTQVQLAERLNVTQAYISDLETGKRSPALSTIAFFSETLGIEPQDLMAKLPAVA